MNKRKRICMMLVIIILLNWSIYAPVHAEAIVQREEDNFQPRYDHTMRTGAVLTFSDGIAYVAGSVSGYRNRTTQINGFLYLQHKVGSDWFIVKTWTGSVKDWTLDITGEASCLSSGTYRVRFVTYVFEGDESEEVIYIGKDVVYNKK